MNGVRIHLFVWLCVLPLLVAQRVASKEAEPSAQPAASATASGMADVKGGKLYYESNRTGPA